MYTRVLVLPLMLCFCSTVNTDHLCPKWIKRSRFYQDYHRVNVRCHYQQEFLEIPSCYNTGYRETFQLETFWKTEYVRSEVVECCPGYSRQNSDEECTTIVQGCEENFFRTGDGCIQCDCNWGNAYPGCAEDSETCFCKPGYYGPQCNSECPDGSFGLYCQYECSCKDKSSCNKTDGQCPCAMPGWTGMTCLDACPPNQYGMFCAETCDCSPDRFCDPEDGCICNPGYTGEACNEECPPENWTHGPACRESCVCQPLGTERCNPVTGACSCKAGWQGDHCTDLCSNGTYGLSCNEACQCELFEVCLPTNGTCVCPRGTFGERCERNLNDTNVVPLAGRHMSSWVAIVSLILLVLVLVAVSTGIVVLVRRYRRCTKIRMKKNESTQPVNDLYSTITDHTDNDHADGNYNSFYDQRPVRKSTHQNQKPYDQVKMISGMYDSFHVSEVATVIGEDYDSVRMSNKNTSSQYDHITTIDDRKNSTIAHVVGSEYDQCVPADAENSDT